MLAVVEQQQQPLGCSAPPGCPPAGVPPPPGCRAPGPRPWAPGRGRPGWPAPPATPRPDRYPALEQLVGELQSQAGLPRAARSRQREQAAGRRLAAAVPPLPYGRLEQGAQIRQFAPPPDEAGQRGGQVVGRRIRDRLAGAAVLGGQGASQRCVSPRAPAPDPRAAPRRAGDRRAGPGPGGPPRRTAASGPARPARGTVGCQHRLRLPSASSASPHSGRGRPGAAAAPGAARAIPRAAPLPILVDIPRQVVAGVQGQRRPAGRRVLPGQRRPRGSGKASASSQARPIPRPASAPAPRRRSAGSLPALRLAQRPAQPVDQHPQVGHAPVRRPLRPEVLHHRVAGQAMPRYTQQPLEEGAASCAPIARWQAVSRSARGRSRPGSPQAGARNHRGFSRWGRSGRCLLAQVAGAGAPILPPVGVPVGAVAPPARRAQPAGGLPQRRYCCV